LGYSHIHLGFIHKRLPQSRELVQCRHFTDKVEGIFQIRTSYLWCKNFKFLEIYSGEGSIFLVFVRTSFMDGPLHNQPKRLSIKEIRIKSQKNDLNFHLCRKMSALSEPRSLRTHLNFGNILRPFQQKVRTSTSEDLFVCNKQTPPT